MFELEKLRKEIVDNVGIQSPLLGPFTGKYNITIEDKPVIPDSLIEYEKRLIEFVEPFYRINDQAHGLDHVQDVFATSLEITNKLVKLKCIHYDFILNSSNIKILMLASYLHDVFSSIDRENHEERGSDAILEYVYEDYESEFDIFKYLTNEELKTIAFAIREHRGSYIGDYYSLVSKIISAADRGRPDIHEMLERLYTCACDKSAEFRYPNDVEEKESKDMKEHALDRSYYHLKDKFSSTGYANYNRVYKVVYGAKLEELRKIVDKITRNDIEEYVSCKTQKEKIAVIENIKEK